MFGWLICIMAICCRKKEKVEGDGQDEFGVNFHEYEQWKQGQPISERPLPRNYDVLGLKTVNDIASKTKETTLKVQATVGDYSSKANDKVQQTKQMISDSKGSAKNMMKKLNFQISLGADKKKKV